ncbi:MAG: hypothetical protein WCL16_02530 [bacterium]
MKQRVMQKVALVVMIGALSFIGACKRQAPAASLDDIVQQARQEVERGNFDKGIAMLEGAFRNAAFEQARVPLLGEILRFNLMAGRVDAAEASFLKVLQSDVGVAAATFGAIERYLYDQKQYDALEAWAVRVTSEAKLPPELVAAAASWHCMALRAASKPLKTALSGYLVRLPAPLGCKLVTEVVGSSDGSSAALESLLAVGEQAYGKTALWMTTAASLRLDARLKHGTPVEVVDFVKTTAPTLVLGDAAQMVAYGAGALLGKGQADAADALCVWAVEQSGARPALRDAVASVWVDAAAMQAAPSQATATRLAVLKSSGLGDERLLALIGSSEPRVLQENDKNAMQALLAMTIGFNFATNQRIQQAEADGVILDLSFCTEAYGSALMVLDRGVFGQDVAWHKLMRTKVLAHQALKAGRTDEAVAKFREFMSGIEKQSDAQIDPVSQMRYTREMILGFNARRIGDILSKSGRMKEAGDAYVQSRAWFKQAAAVTGKESKEGQWIAAETAKLPAGS